MEFDSVLKYQNVYGFNLARRGSRCNKYVHVPLVKVSSTAIVLLVLLFKLYKVQGIDNESDRGALIGTKGSTVAAVKKFVRDNFRSPRFHIDIGDETDAGTGFIGGVGAGNSRSGNFCFINKYTNRKNGPKMKRD